MVPPEIPTMGVFALCPPFTKLSLDQAKDVEKVKDKAYTDKHCNNKAVSYSHSMAKSIR